MKKTYIQIGSGVGDQDPRADFRDGFTEYVKAQPIAEVGQIVLVEPNPMNIPLLIEGCWRDYCALGLVKLYTVGVVPEIGSSSSTTFYYCDEDAPHYQVFSLEPGHVSMHYPSAELRSVQVPIISIRELLADIVGKGSSRVEVDTLGLDIEGIDYSVLMAIDWSLFSCKYLSYEVLHLNQRQREDIRIRLTSAGYQLCLTRAGLDPRGYDVMWENCNNNI